MCRRPAIIEVDALKQFLDTVPTADMMKLTKNGSDITTVAVGLARAATGHSRIALCRERPFFSTDD